MTDELDAREKVTIETAYAMDDSCQMQFWARGSTEPAMSAAADARHLNAATDAAMKEKAGE